MALEPLNPIFWGVFLSSSAFPGTPEAIPELQRADPEPQALWGQGLRRGCCRGSFCASAACGTAGTQAGRSAEDLEELLGRESSAPEQGASSAGI